MLVIKLGGTNGSGKTSVARALLDKVGNPLPIGWEGTTSYRGVIDHKYWMILGKYETACGGMDTISKKEKRLALVLEATHSLRGYSSDVVFFEGLITGKTYGAFGVMSEEQKAKGIHWIYAFMDTPFEVCVERVIQRRQTAWAAKGKVREQLKDLDATRTMLPTYKSVQAVAKRAAAQGHAVLWLPHAQPPQAIAEHILKYVANFDKVKGKSVCV